MLLQLSFSHNHHLSTITPLHIEVVSLLSMKALAVVMGGQTRRLGFWLATLAAHNYERIRLALRIGACGLPTVTEQVALRLVALRHAAY